MADVYFEVRVSMLLRGEQCITGFGLFGDVDVAHVGGITLSDVANALVGANFTDKLAACMTTADSVDSLLVREMKASPSSVVSEQVRSVAHAGSLGVGDDRLPNEVCGLLHIATDAAIRSGRGRMWLPSPRASNAVTADGKWDHTAGYWLAVQALITQMGHLNSGGSVWTGLYGSGASFGVGVLSRTRRFRGDPQFAFHATAYSLRDKMHWLRSRQG